MRAFEEDGTKDDGRRALILDQLSLTIPNPNAIQATERLLREAGFDVAYIPGEAVTVERYASLAADGYDLIILRSHAARTAPGARAADFSLFTSVAYDEERYVKEQAAGGLLVAEYQDDPGERYFSVTHQFVDDVMDGDFGGATILIMGCDGLRTPTMAEALLRKGADNVIGWNDLVSAPHTDAAMERLVRHLVVDELPPATAMERTQAELGPDPSYGSTLVWAGWESAGTPEALDAAGSAAR